MEELRSTETLDREILEDARKKADRILKSAEQTLRSTAETWAASCATAIAELERLHAERSARRTADSLARLPLDERRIRSERTDRLLRGAAERYLATLPRAKVLDLLAGELQARRDFLPTGAITVSARGLSREEALASLGLSLADRAWTLDTQTPDGLPELRLDAPDVRVTASVPALVAEILDDRRAELVTALFGQGATDD